MKPWLTIFIAVSALLHFLIVGLGGKWVWRPPAFDMIVEPPPVIIQITEFTESPPEESVPISEPVITPEQLDPEPEPLPETEVIEPFLEEIPPEPDEVVPEELEETPAETLQAEQPSYLRNPAPPYPLQARRKGWEGKVIIRVDVNANGTVGAIEVAQSSGHAALDEAALRTIRRWIFSPARLAGHPVSAIVEIPISFKLKSSSASP